MLKKYAQYSIIGIIQLAAIAILLLLIAPLLLKNTNTLSRWHECLIHFRILFFLSHSLFYIALYYSWPRIFQYLANRQSNHPTVEQIRIAMHARNYLIGTFLLFEILNLVR